MALSKKTDWFKGIFPALVTPFDKADQIDEKAFREFDPIRVASRERRRPLWHDR